MRTASSSGRKRPAMLWTMAWWKRPLAAGADSNAATEAPSPDSPNTVTLSASPPNRAMFSATQRSAAAWSRKPRLAGASGRYPKPSKPTR